MATTARRQRVRAGMTFYHVYADGNVKWEVLRRDGQQTWICRSTDDNLDWGGITKAFTSADILHSVNRELLWKDLGDACDAWYQSQSPGTIVHYHNSFGQFVRCEIVRLEADCTMRTGTVYRAGEHVLRPLALVGAWRAYDLPRRTRTGEITYPYHVKSIRAGDDYLKPDYMGIFEANRERLEARHGDPRSMEAIDLSVPDMTPEEQVEAARWKLIEDVQQACSQQNETASEIIDRIQALLSR